MIIFRDRIARARARTYGTTRLVVMTLVMVVPFLGVATQVRSEPDQERPPCHALADRLTTGREKWNTGSLITAKQGERYGT